MAYHLSAWVQCSNQSQAELLGTFLARATRPVFVEDVKEQDRSLYELIEAVDFPEELEVQADCLWLNWHDIENFGFKQLKIILDEINVRALVVFEVPDCPMSGDEDETSGWFWMEEHGQYIKVTREVVVAHFQKEIIERFPDWAGVS